MHKSNAVQLRLALSAAAACAVLAAATFSGAHRAGSLSIIVARQVEPILARSVSTIRTPSIENLEDFFDASSRPFDEALLRRAFDVAKAAQEAGDHPFGTVLADEKGQIPHRAGERIYEAKATPAQATPSGCLHRARRDIAASHSSPDARSILLTDLARCAPARSTGPASGASSLKSLVCYLRTRRPPCRRISGRRGTLTARALSRFEEPGAAAPGRDDQRRMIMADIELKKVEEQLNHELLFSVCVSADEGHMEFPIGVKDQGLPAANEAAVLASTLAFAEVLRDRGATEVSARRSTSVPVERYGANFLRSRSPLCATAMAWAIARSRRLAMFSRAEYASATAYPVYGSSAPPKREAPNAPAGPATSIRFSS